MGGRGGGGLFFGRGGEGEGVSENYERDGIWIGIETRNTYVSKYFHRTRVKRQRRSTLATPLYIDGVPKACTDTDTDGYFIHLYKNRSPDLEVPPYADLFGNVVSRMKENARDRHHKKNTWRFRKTSESWSTCHFSRNEREVGLSVENNSIMGPRPPTAPWNGTSRGANRPTNQSNPTKIRERLTDPKNPPKFLPLSFFPSNHPRLRHPHQMPIHDPPSRLLPMRTERSGGV